uniref:Profilin n=1 Tax=Paramoeba aestuarina TaxID=180227 RepID=A0A7S4U5Z3_9EUKA|mmetsp:Transcript_34642/g.54081  ORF Transcript_34642/g.54081 Transcript_34642/m.54081 type:complete len:132 (+) Transcript_34642:56-451(+)|eukprot:CAMPEP_0201526342 /NCGR_PEP_ID=MMETSP0161_2-20130828/31484_1 /ASSEMBLY_ACC=CAM_ASM_000251 /TAXON_ID=180227 /ORGANISM="Neoparamoeba aestuarina, Strain SoJaBio B1-5/56/2" /LENGTH=131 /DNA_ID=CAMNT_0047926689 /DNA_START=47 /DNA_END=442 /DNA_ORIENTATION=-
MADGWEAWAKQPGLKGCIIGDSDGLIWGKYPAKLETKGWVELVEGLLDTSKVQSHGVSFNGKHHVCLQADEEFIHVKAGQEGVLVKRSGPLVIVGIYGVDDQPGPSNAKLAATLRTLVEAGYGQNTDNIKG